MGRGARRQRAPLHLPDVLKGSHGGHTRLELSIIPWHQEDGVLLGQDEMNRRGHRTGRGRVRRFKRNRRQVRAVPHHPMVWPPYSAWQPPQPLHYPAQCVLVDKMRGRPLDATVQGLLHPAQVRSNDGGINHVQHAR